MKEPTITIRFSIFSKEKESSSYYEQIRELLPNSSSSQLIDKYRVLSNGNIRSKKNTETSFDFELIMKSYDLLEVHKKWMDFWLPYFGNIKLIKEKYGFEFHLNYEITINEKNYPSMYFPVDFTSILSDLDIEFSIYFYNY